MNSWFTLACSARLAVSNVRPLWFTTVMGTGILAVSLALAPISPALIALQSASAALFALASLGFVTLVTLFAVQLVESREPLLASLRDPANVHGWGAPSMACFTLSIGCLKIGTMIVSSAHWITAAQILWIAGVLLGLFSASYVPYLMFTEHALEPKAMNGSWLLSVVPPIVAPVPAALLAMSWPVALRGTMLGGAYALLGIGLAIAAIIIVIFYARLLFFKVPDGALVISMWLGVGPLGQSAAAAIALGTAARAVWPQFGSGLLIAGVAYGLLAWGFGVYWLGMAIATTLRAMRRNLPFALGWWAFTFPIGTLIAASYALGATTGAVLFTVSGIALLALLIALWTLVAARTLRHALTAIALAMSKTVPVYEPIQMGLE